MVETAGHGSGGPLDERSQWAAMLTLNRGPGSLSILEEALVLREMQGVGLSQVELGELVGRHKSWVCRRVGLVERLHPELVEAVRIGLLTAGVARRLLSLPAGNQLEVAAVVQRVGLGARETELLVSLWQRTADPEVRRYLLTHPREALSRMAGEDGPAVNPRLTPRGRQLQRLLRILLGVLPRTASALQPAPTEQDGVLLRHELENVRPLLTQTLRLVGCVASCDGSVRSDARDDAS